MIGKHLFVGGVAFALAISCFSQTWAPANAPSANWGSPVYSTNGDKVFAVARLSGIYASTNHGLDWSRTSAPETNWTSVACSADGSEVVATVSKNPESFPWGNYPGPIFISRDSGLTWQQSSAPIANWSSVACSFDGKTLLAAAGDGFNDGPLYVSTNSGVTWTAFNNIAGRWSTVGISGDGRFFAKADYGSIYVSTNSGATWNLAGVGDSYPNITGSGSFGLVSGSADGMHLAAFQVCGPLYTSDDGGTNWMLVPDSGGLWQAIAASPNGDWRLVMEGSSRVWVSYVPESLPFFVTEPVPSTNVVETTSFTLKGVALGSAPIVYQWRHNGTNLTDDARTTGSTTTELTVTNLVVGDTGNYALVASNYLGVTNSETSIVTVSADQDRPQVLISSPSPGEKVAGAGFSANGVVRDNGNVSGVWCRLNDGPWFVPRNYDNWQSWVADFSPTNGMNLFSAFAIDAVGNVSFTNSVSFKAEVQGRLWVVAVGPGKVKSPQNDQYLDLGSACKITAKPDKGYIFTGWTGDLQSDKPAISFKLTNSMNIAGNFVTNPFTEATGNYEGRMSILGPLPVPGSLFKVHLLKDGSFVAKFSVGKQNFQYSGKFASDGTAKFTIGKKGLIPFDVNLKLDLNGGSGIKAEFSGFDFIAEAVATKLTK